MYVVDAVRVVGLNEDDDRIFIAELIADLAIDMDLAYVHESNVLTIPPHLRCTVQHSYQQTKRYQKEWNIESARSFHE